MRYLHYKQLVSSVLFCIFFITNVHSQVTFQATMTRLTNLKNQYGDRSEQYLKSLLDLSDYCDEDYIEYFSEIASLIIENEVNFSQYYGIDSPEYLSAIKILDMLFNGKFLDPDNFVSYGDKIITVMKNLENKLNYCKQNRNKFLCYITSMYLDIIPNPTKALYYGNNFFDNVKFSKNPNLDQEYHDAVSRLIGAYELNNDKTLFMEWIKKYFISLENLHKKEIKQSALLIFLEYISPDEFPNIRDFLLNQICIQDIDINYLWIILGQWGYNEYYESLSALEDIVLSSKNNLLDVAIANVYIGNGIINSEENGYEKSTKYFEKALSIKQDPINSFIVGIKIFDCIEALDLNKKLFWAEKNVNIFNHNRDSFVQGDDNNTNEIISHLIKVANLYCDLGLYSKAISLSLNILSIYSNYLIENKSLCRLILGNLGDYYSFIAEYKKAFDYTNKALSLYSEEEDMEKVQFLHNSAVFMYQLEDINKAIETEEMVLSILDKTPIKDNNFFELYSGSLCYLGLFYSEINKFEKAIEIGQKSINMAKLFLGSHHKYIPTYLHFLASYYVQKNINESIRLESEACNLYLKNFGPSHDFYINSLGNLMSLQYQVNDINGLISNFSLLSNNALNYIKSLFIFLPKYERDNFWNERKNLFCNYVPYITYSCNNPQITANAYNLILLTKGCMLNSEQEILRFLSENDSDVLHKKYNDIRNLRLQLNKLYEKPISERYMDTDSLEMHAVELERQLMEECQEFGDYTKRLCITLEDVKERLGQNDVAIEFVSFPNQNDSTMYMAYVLKKDSDFPLLVKLFEEKELRNLSDSDLYSKRQGSNLIWGKLYPYLKGVKNVYFAPDGILHQIAIEYFPDFENNELIADRYNLYRLSSTRELALNKHRDLYNEAVIYGGIKYDTDVKTMEEESGKYTLSASRGAEPFYNLTDSLSVRGGVKYLPYTLHESMTIDSLMQNNNYQHNLIAGKEGSEESVKNLSGSHKSLIHIATHGFYWENDEAEDRASNNNRLFFMSELGNKSPRNIEDKALTRSGLLMAGANNALSGKELPENVDDGILTAKEIADLDFRNLDLVVLSACQTGMGDLSGDGVFGLQRGFKKAGANSILMSLWDVDDKATQILMTEFYKNYLGGMSKQKSLNEAQRVVRETPGFEDPEFWAAFILLDGLN